VIKEICRWYRRDRVADINLPQVSSGLSTQQLADIVARLIKEVAYLTDRNIDGKNVRPKSVTADLIKAGAVEADKIKAGAVTADKIDVDQLSAISADIGHITAGLVESISLIGSFIATSMNSYPRVEISSTSKIFQALASISDFIRIISDTAGHPSINIYNGAVDANIYAVGSSFVINTSVGKGSLQLTGDEVRLSPNPGGLVKIQDWNTLFNNSSGVTLQQSLNGKANVFSGVTGTFYVSATSGGPATKRLDFFNGVLTSAS